MPLRVFFDLSRQEEWHRREWERTLGALSRDKNENIAIESSGALADVVVNTMAPQIADALPPGRKRSRLDRKVITWDAADFPTGRYSGLYCSLDKRLFDAGRHATFCYPISYNEVVDFTPLETASVDFSFHGGITSGVRQKIVALWQGWGKFNATCVVQGGPWKSMFDRSGLDVKVRYAEGISKSRFVICPRGNGHGSIRLFEVLKAGRVPVIISDRYVLPPHIDWTSCAIVVPEIDVAALPEIVAAHMPRWSAMAATARRTWEEHFSSDGLLTYMGSIIPAIAKAAAGEDETLGQYVTRTASLAGISAALYAKPRIGRLVHKIRRAG
ncbi:exostosin family protein [uncultured Alsobacter sp.]|uniref:exostosin domain-containing protein n=1 Tax=uncultured Alsobacter sp. TaxID=1748258 RepID=UPI0025D2413E|nr:exostosin family protein [uncultured Alsobacter sp.]